VRKAPDQRELLARLRKYRGRLPKDFRFDRLEAHQDGQRLDDQLTVKNPFATP
jgi:hypothetical protein